jgi:hypothetical protein
MLKTSKIYKLHKAMQPQLSRVRTSTAASGGRPDASRVVISDVLGGKDVVEVRDGRTDGRFCLLGIGRNGQIL